MLDREPKITLGLMRADNGPTRLTVNCPQCSHHVVMDSNRWPDDVRLSDLEPRMVCEACGHRGADVRPLFEAVRMGTRG